MARWKKLIFASLLCLALLPVVTSLQSRELSFPLQLQEASSLYTGTKDLNYAFFYAAAGGVPVFNITYTETFINGVTWIAATIALRWNGTHPSTASSCDCPASGDWYIGGCTITTNCAMSAASTLYINGTASVQDLITGCRFRLNTGVLTRSNAGIILCNG